VSVALASLCSNGVSVEPGCVQAPTAAVGIHHVHQVRGRDPTIQPHRLARGNVPSNHVFRMLAAHRAADFRTTGGQQTRRTPGDQIANNAGRASSRS
jgi:hypothetical protein